MGGGEGHGRASAENGLSLKAAGPRLPPAAFFRCSLLEFGLCGHTPLKAWQSMAERLQKRRPKSSVAQALKPADGILVDRGP